MSHSTVRVVAIGCILLSFAAVSLAQTAEQTLDQARSYVEKKDYSAAIKEYDKISDWLWRDPGLVIERARVYTYVNLHRQAIDLFEQVIAKHPDQSPIIERELKDQRFYLVLENARSLTKAGNYPQALDEYDRIRELLWRDAGLIIEFARVYAYAGRSDDALTLLEEAGRKFPDQAQLFQGEQKELQTQIVLERARNLVEKKEYAAALAEYAVIADRIWKESSLAIEYARVHTYADMHNEAIELYEKIADKFPDQARLIEQELNDQRAFVILKKARDLAKNKDYPAALSEYEKISDWLWRDAGLVIERARIFTYADQHEQAIDLLEQVAKKFPDQAESIERELNDQRAFVILKNARALLDKKDYTAALVEYEKIADWLWRDPGLVVEHAKVYAYADRIDDARALLDEVKRKAPERSAKINKELEDLENWITLERARLFVTQRDYPMAIGEYQKIADWLWNDPGLVMERARVYTYANMHEEAIKLFDEVAEKFPNYADIAMAEATNQRNWIILHRAQNLVEEEKYDAALQEYHKISDWLWHNPNLVIEYARVNSYARRHKEAIYLFEQVRKKHPDQQAEFLIELGYMYLWNNQISEAIAVYREALAINNDSKARLGLARALVWNEQYKEALVQYDAILADHPDLIEAMTGKAYALSWVDRLEEAYDLYEKVRQIDPGNLSARIGQARITVWQGYHRKGIKAYRDILADYPGDPDATEGLGFALHWDGRTRQAVDVLQNLLKDMPDRTKASELMYSIKYAQNPYLYQYNDFSRDRNSRRIQTHSMTAGVPLDYDTVLEAIYAFQRIWDNNNGRVNGNTGGMGIQRRLGDQCWLDAYLYGTSYDRRGWEVFTANTKLTWNPDDLWKFDGGYDRETFSNVKSILNKVVTDGWFASAAFRPNRIWLFDCNFKQRFFSDTNRQESVLAKAEYRLTHIPFLKLYYNFYFSQWDKQLASGYFNPKRFRSHTLGLYASKRLSKKLFIEGQVSVGYEVHTPIVRTPTMFFAGGLKYRFNENWAIRTRGEYFKSWEDRDSSGYSNIQVMLSVVYSFGEVKEKAPESFETVTEPLPTSR